MFGWIIRALGAVLGIGLIHYAFISEQFEYGFFGLMILAMLGVLFGVGGLIGMYCGAKWQRFMPEKMIKCILAIIIFIVSGKYIFQYF